MSTEARLTTHVLDAARGRPAAGVAVTVRRFPDDGSAPLAATVTNDDGRTDAPLLPAHELGPGTYELTFAVGRYFAGSPLDPGVPPEPPYLDEVPIRITVDGREPVHVALLVTPWSYTTYRGS